MNYSKFLIWTILLTIIYYSIQIVFDLFLKKDKKGKIYDYVDVNIVEDVGQESPMEVADELPYIIPEKKKNALINESNPIDIESFIDNAILDESDSIDMEVESQGIPYEMLIKEGKSMFAGVSF